MKEQIAKQILDLMGTQHHSMETIVKKILLVGGFFAQEVPEDVEVEMSKIHTHLHLIAGLSTFSEKIGQALRKDVDLRIRSETIDIGHQHDLQTLTLQNHPNINLNLGSVEIKIDLSELIAEYKTLSDKIDELRINYPKIIGWTVQKARDIGYLD
ncbi:MAG: hypothetical protein WBD22_12100 [Pyrinomonadaceae bacterium]